MTRDEYCGDTKLKFDERRVDTTRVGKRTPSVGHVMSEQFVP